MKMCKGRGMGGEGRRDKEWSGEPEKGQGVEDGRRDKEWRTGEGTRSGGREK